MHSRGIGWGTHLDIVGERKYIYSSFSWEKFSLSRILGKPRRRKFPL
jgi:hypothetical protein